MREVVLAYQPRVAEALPLVEACADLLQKRGVGARLHSSGDLDRGVEVGGAELVVTFGGDGTILRTARWLAGAAIPIVGVQMGRLGFLAELLPRELPEALEPYLAREFWEDRRSMVRSSVSPGHELSPSAELLALNDVVVGRGPALRTIAVDVAMNGSMLHTFHCDGVIVATATGSTAYSFAAGGPVLAPDSTDMVVTAICPHNAALKSFVVPGDASLQLQVWTGLPAVVTMDGQIDHDLADGATVEARLSDCSTTFARRGTPADYYRRVLAKLH
jgi:NAD+ kinase